MSSKRPPRGPGGKRPNKGPGGFSGPFGERRRSEPGSSAENNSGDGKPGENRPPLGRRGRRWAQSQGSRQTALPPLDGRILLYGYHPVREALVAGRRTIFKLHATQNAADRLAGELAAAGVTPEIVTIEDIAHRLPADAVHQGLIAEVSELPAPDLADLPADGLVLVLDQVTDPHNVGAIVRTAAAFGVDAIITTERHSPALGGVLAKSASGGLEHVPVITVVNLARALEKLEDAGYLRAGLDSSGSMSFEAMDLHRPLALVLGAEGKGLRRLTRENCDMVARLDMPGAIKSLNVSNACAVALAIAHIKLNLKL